MTTTEKIILGILANVVPDDRRNQVSLTSNLRKDLGLDSFKLITLVMELQNQTDFDITRVESNEDLKRVTTAQDLVTIVEKQQSNPGS